MTQEEVCGRHGRPRVPVGLLVAMSMMGRRSEAAADGRPGERQGWVQRRAIRRRCQRNRSLAQRASQIAAVVGEGWSAVQVVQDHELVTQHDDLKVLRASRTHSQANQRHEQVAGAARRDRLINEYRNVA